MNVPSVVSTSVNYGGLHLMKGAAGEAREPQAISVFPTPVGDRDHVLRRNVLAKAFGKLLPPPAPADRHRWYRAWPMMYLSNSETIWRRIRCSSCDIIAFDRRTS